MSELCTTRNCQHTANDASKSCSSAVSGRLYTFNVSAACDIDCESATATTAAAITAAVELLRMLHKAYIVDTTMHVR
jgi:hypothetical protein